MEYINPSLSRFSLANIVGDIRESMLNELDFTKERTNIEEFSQILERQGSLRPMPRNRFTATQRVLIMEYLKGVPLVDLEGIKQYSNNPRANSCHCSSDLGVKCRKLQQFPC